MLPGFASLVEERILKAQKNGELDNLPGHGRPLNLEDMDIPEEFRMAHRILKNSGFLPPEVELRKQIRQLEEILESIDGEVSSNTSSDMKTDGRKKEEIERRAHIQKKLDFLILKLNTDRGNASLSATFHSQYRNKIIKRML